jgi:hypothetical protein
MLLPGIYANTKDLQGEGLLSINNSAHLEI